MSVECGHETTSQQELDRGDRAAISSGFRSMVALLVVLVSIGPGIDFDKPTHQVLLSTRLAETALLPGLPAFALTLATILLWRQTKFGWWLCVLADSAVTLLGIAFVIDDMDRFSDIQQHPALYGDVLYHFAVFLVSALALVFLFSRGARMYPLTIRGIAEMSDALGPSNHTP